MRKKILRAVLRFLAVAAASILLLAVLVNIGCIIYYHTPFYEVFTQIGYTVVIALGFYIIWTAIRLIVWLFRKKK